MQWIKRNLLFVVGGVVALLLMTLAIFYVMQSIKNSSDVQEEINGQIAELTRLYEKDPFPSDENIALAKQEQQRAKELLGELKGFFTPVVSLPVKDNHEFQELLGTTILDLQKQAASLGVVLPPQYAFTFSGQRNALQLSPASIEPWLAQLAEIRALCYVLYQAKVNEIYGIRRAPITDDDKRQANATDYLVNSPVITNQTAIFAPYEISFRGFSAEIAGVLNGFLQSSNCFIVKSVTIDPAPFTPPVNAPATFNSRVPSPIPYSAAPEGNPIPRPIQPAQPVRSPASGGKSAGPASVTVLSERPLRVTMVVETVKLRDRK
jgi:hypothetical protein